MSAFALMITIRLAFFMHLKKLKKDHLNPSRWLKFQIVGSELLNQAFQESDVCKFQRKYYFDVGIYASRMKAVVNKVWNGCLLCCVDEANVWAEDMYHKFPSEIKGTSTTTGGAKPTTKVKSGDAVSATRPQVLPYGIRRAGAGDVGPVSNLETGGCRNVHASRRNV